MDAEDTDEFDEEIVRPPSAPDANKPNFLKLCWLKPSSNKPEFNIFANSWTDLIPSPGSVEDDVKFILLPSDKFIEIFEKPFIWLSYIPNVAEDCFNKDEILISFVLLGIVAIAPSFRNSEAKSGFVEELKTSLIFGIWLLLFSTSFPIILSSA